MTPFQHPDQGPQQRFNRSLTRTRVLVEQTIGILKRRFNIMHQEIRMKPLRASLVIQACVTLHNIGRDRDRYWPDGIEDIGPLPENIQAPPARRQGEVVRRNIIQKTFGH